MRHDLTPRQIAVREDLRRVAQSLGRPDGWAPNSTAYRRSPLRTFSEYKVLKYAGTERWLDAMRVYRLRPASDLPSRFEIDADLRRVAKILELPSGVMPPAPRYEELGIYSPSTVAQAVLGHWRRRWNEVAEALSFAVRRHHAQDWTAERLVEDCRRIHTARRIRPGELALRQKDFFTSTRYSITIVKARFGTYNALVEAAGYATRLAYQYHPRRREQRRAA